MEHLEDRVDLDDLTKKDVAADVVLLVNGGSVDNIEFSAVEVRGSVVVTVRAEGEDDERVFLLSVQEVDEASQAVVSGVREAALDGR